MDSGLYTSKCLFVQFFHLHIPMMLLNNKYFYFLLLRSIFMIYLLPPFMPPISPARWRIIFICANLTLLFVGIIPFFLSFRSHIYGVEENAKGLTTTDDVQQTTGRPKMQNFRLVFGQSN